MFCTEDQWKQTVLNECLELLRPDYSEISELTERAEIKTNVLNESGSTNAKLCNDGNSPVTQRENVPQVLKFSLKSQSISTFTSSYKRPQLHLCVLLLITYCWNSLKLPFPLSPTILKTFKVLNHLPVTQRVHLTLHADHFCRESSQGSSSTAVNPADRWSKICLRGGQFSKFVLLGPSPSSEV